MTATVVRCGLEIGLFGRRATVQHIFILMWSWSSAGHFGWDHRTKLCELYLTVMALQ